MKEARVKIKNRQQMLALGAGAVVALFVADKILIEPLRSSWKDRAELVAKLRKKVEDGRSLIRREQNLRGRWEQMRTNTLPSSQSMAEQQILKAFDGWYQDSRVTPASISSQWKHDADNYMTVEYRVEATGTLPAVARFLHDVEKDPMALKLQNVEISSHDNNGQQITLGLQISGLVLTPQESKR
jgi:Tfp pilus assembly protein PilO